MKQRILIEDALKHLFDCEYERRAATVESLAGALSLPREQMTMLISLLETQKLAGFKGGRIRLTRQGRKYAKHVVRAHRLYETLLAEKTGFDQLAWHREAEAAEHRLSEAEVNKLADRLGHPRFDPHGDPIPSRTGAIPPVRGKRLAELPKGWEGRVAHIEDEPRDVYAEIVKAGLAPEVRLRILEISDRMVLIAVAGQRLELSRQAAANIRAMPLERGEKVDEAVERLSVLGKGERASIVGLSPACRGVERYRLLDLGIVPGSVVEMGFESPFKSPTAYLVRGSMVALRREQAEHVLIKKIPEKVPEN